MSGTYQMLLDAEHADWLLQAHIDNGGEIYDIRWHMLQAQAHRAWDRYHDTLLAKEEGAPCPTS